MLRGQIVFKGGTSLSKVFGVIERFSEDVDVSVSPGFLGFSEKELEALASKNQRDKKIKQLEKECGKKVAELVQPALEAAVINELGVGKSAWFDLQTDDRTQCPVLYFRYSSHVGDGYGYLRRSVKLEFGSLTDQQPRGEYSITPWVAEEFPQLFGNWRCTVTALEVERSFWEKATILHAEYHRPEDKATPIRFSRHYSDVAALARSEHADRAIARTDLRDRVSDWKRRFFSTSWASYETAKPGSLKLVPPDYRIQHLRDYYAAMRDVFMSEPVPFDAIMSELAELQQKLNVIN